MKLCMIGTGYVGLVSGVCFADLGNDVICVDKDINKIKNLKNCENYLFETEVRRILNKFFKNEIGKKPQISICIHRMDIM